MRVHATGRRHHAPPGRVAVLVDDDVVTVTSRVQNTYNAVNDGLDGRQRGQ
jgi:hypothetical protein